MWISHSCLLSAAVLVTSLNASPAQGKKYQPPNNWKYVTSNETVAGKLNIHITPHTHDDTGWLMTVDQYYYSQVRYILDSVTDQLLKDPKRKFNYVEMAFFSRWWEEQSNETKAIVRELVSNKQLEFLNGGWCMHDEAGPYYTEMVDQTTRGHQFIMSEFGPEASPRATWQIDPFGHSNTQAWLLASEAGMPSLFWARMDYDDRNERQQSKNLEYIWRGSETIGDQADTFGGVIWGSDKSGRGLYSCPVNFESYDSIGIQDNPLRHDYNVDEWVERMVSIALEQSGDFKSNHIMWVCGFDFSHKNADTWYHNTDVLMHYVNQDGRVNMLYSSPASYVDAKNRDKSQRWQVRKDDLMPLHEFPHVYWTGYFSSRVAFKRLVRKSWNYLSAARQVEFLSRFLPASKLSQAEDNGELPRSPRVGTTWTDSLEGALSVAMHHDGISGTAKQNVNGDYASRISEGLSHAQKWFSQSFKAIIGDEGSAPWVYCESLNISVCDLSAKQTNTGFSVAAWNPLGQTHPDANFRIPVQLPDHLSAIEDLSDSSVLFSITTGSNGSEQSFDSQLIKLDKRTLELPLFYLNWFGMSKAEMDAQFKKLENPATHVLLFQASLPPAGFTIFSINPSSCVTEHESSPHCKNIDSKGSNKQQLRSRTDHDFDNGVYRISLDPISKAVQSITNLETGKTCSLKISWGWYESSPGGCSDFGCQETPSGAYIFRSNSTTYNYPGEENGIQTTIIEGTLSTEIRQKLSPWVSHVIRLDRNARSVKFEYTVGPIPQENAWMKDKIKANLRLGKELVVRYQTCLTGSKGEFYTDSNGLEMVRRVRNERPDSYPKTYSWLDEPISSNYYPVNSIISLQDNSNGLNFAVITDSTQGGSSIHDGEVELMPLRRVFHDDFKGVEEPLNETMCGCNGQHEESCFCHGLTVRGVHHLIFDSNEQRVVSSREQHSPILQFSKGGASVKLHTGSILSNGLDPALHLMTLSSNYANLHSGKVLVRLHHLHGVSETKNEPHPRPISLSFKSMFNTNAIGEVTAVEEMTLTANRPIEKKFKYNWSYENYGENNSSSGSTGSSGRGFFNESSGEVVIKGMEVRTFLVSFGKKFLPVTAEAIEEVA